MSVDISKEIEHMRYKLSQLAQKCDSASASNLLEKAEKLINEAIELEANV
jgi:hypothetical protein